MLFLKFLLFLIFLSNILMLLYIRTEFNAFKTAILFNDSLLRQLNFGQKEFLIRIDRRFSDVCSKSN